MCPVRGVSVFFLVLLFCIIFPTVYADEATNISNPVNSSQLVNETINQSEILNVTTITTEPTPEPTILETILPEETVQPEANKTTLPVPAENLPVTTATTEPTPKPTVTETVPHEETATPVPTETPLLTTAEPTPEPTLSVNNTPDEIDIIQTNSPQESLLVQEYQSGEPVNTSGSSKITGTSRASTRSIVKSSDGREYVRDQVIIRYNSNRFQDTKAMKANTASSTAKIGARVEKDFSDAGLSGLQVIALPETVSVDDAIAEYQKNPDVLYAEPNYVFTISTVTPNDPYYSYLWGLHNTGSDSADIAAPEAWGISTGSSSVVVAVIDTGVNYNHPDLSANIWTNTDDPVNGIDDDLNGYIDDVHGWDFHSNTSDPLDDNGHGTHVAGTIGAVGNNGIGVTGVNWNVRIMPLKFLNSSGSGYTDDAVSAILYADANGASIISNSWGGDGYSQTLKDAIDASPAVVVCAAGNSANNSDTDPEYPAAFTSANIISVAATDSNDQLASYSNYGLTSVDLAAPGSLILSTTYDGSYGYKYGTSMATPHVSGVAALVKSVNPGLTNIQIRNIILGSVDVKSSLSGKVSSNGRLNAYKAVQAVDAEVISTSIPPMMVGGQSYPVTVTMKNTGTMTWSEGSLIRLGGVGDSLGDAKKFGRARIYIPTGTSVAPGEQYTFTFTMTAPTTVGTYTPTYRMVWDLHQWFGDQTSATILVTSPVNAEVVSISIPSTMTAGQSYPVTVTMKNTGTMTWSEGSLIRLGGVGDSLGDAKKFGRARIYIPTGTSVAPGEQYTFTFTMTAPTTVGTYTPTYRMVWDLHQWFGDQTSATIQVIAPSVNAEVVSNTIPATMTAGQSYSVTVTMRNTGTMTWSEGSMIRLGGVGDSLGDAKKFGRARIYIPTGTSVAPGEQYTFTFTMTAPTIVGTYTPTYRMVWDLHQWFGSTVSQSVYVA